jgi:aspartate/methionine/tyrosine aminotransferase
MLKSPSMFIGISGKEYISFGSGQPDLPPPENIYNANPRLLNHRYGLIQGEPWLREALVKDYPGSKADDFVITNGASEALDLVLRHLGMNGGKILMHKPYYYSYLPLVKMAGLEPVFVKTEDGKISIEDFDRKIKGCKAVLINSPCNPTGRIQEISTLKHIEKVCKELNITIISDEVYKELIYERENYMMQGDHVVTINSFSKTFNMCGYRVGYLYSNDKTIIDGVCEIKTHTSMNTSIISQMMAFEATKIDRNFVKKQVEIWKQRRDYISKGLDDLGLKHLKPEGAFYVLVDVKEPEKMLLDLFHKYKVITYLGEWFGAPGTIRLSYALDIEKIDEGLRRIKKYLSEKN